MCLQRPKSVLRTALYIHLCIGAAYGKIGRMLGGDNKNDLTNENQPMLALRMSKLKTTFL